MEVPGKETTVHERIEEDLQEDHQKVDLMMKVIHWITTVANHRQTRKRTWKDQIFLIRKKDRGLNLDPLVIIHPI